MFRLSNILLALVATLVVCTAVVVSRDGGFGQIFGSRQIEAGAKFFEFNPIKIRSMDIRMDGNSARFEQDANGVWWGCSPWIDRMDPRAAAAILQFSLGTEVIDILPRNKVKFPELGLEGPEAVTIRLNRPDGHSAAKYRLGTRSPWVFKDEKSDLEEQSLYAFTEYYDRSDQAYVISGNIRPLFDPHFRRLRDPRPFLFHSSQPEQIRIERNGSEIVIDRVDPNSDWKIRKPIKVTTSGKRMKFLVEGLEKLTAVQVINRSDIKLPESPDQRISIKRFDQDSFVTLEVFPAQDSQASHALATVSDRPNAVFALPLKKLDNLIGLEELPLDVNELRFRYLVDIDRVQLRSIAIEFDDQILISRDDPIHSPYTFRTPKSEPQKVNEEQLKNLLVILGFSSVESFVSDAAVDLSRYHLDAPLMRIELSYFDHDKAQTLLISKAVRNADKTVHYATIAGTKRVVSISENLFSRIAAEPYQWRDKSIFDFPAMDITKLTLTHHGKEKPLVLEFDYINDIWKATRDGKDLSDRLNRNIAETLINTITGMRVGTWLPRKHPQFSNALRAPSFSIAIERKTVDKFGDETGRTHAGVMLASPPGATRPAFYYGLAAPEKEFFSIDIATTRRLGELYQALIEK